MHPHGCCRWLTAKGQCRGPLTLRETRIALAGTRPGVTHAYSARDTMSVARWRRHPQPHRSPHEVEQPSETCRGLRHGERLGRNKRPARWGSLHTLRRACAHPCGGHSGPGPDLPRSRRRRHRRLDPGRDTRRDASANRRLRQSPGGLPPPGVAVTLVSSAITRMDGGYDAQHGQGRADQRQTREPSCCRDCSSILADRRPVRKQRSCGRVALGLPAELARWRRMPPRLVAQGTEPPRVRPPPGGGRRSRALAGRGHEVVAVDSHNALRQARRLGEPAASGCQSRDPREARLSSGHSGETSTTSQERVFVSFP